MCSPQKFHAKYAANSKDQTAESLIAAEVDRFVSQPTLSQSELGVLEARIAVLLSRGKSHPCGSSSAGTRKPAVAVGTTKTVQRPNALVSASAPLKDAWACIVEYNRIEGEESRKAAAMRQKEMQARTKTELDRQLAEKRARELARLLKEREAEARQVGLETQREQQARLQDKTHRDQVRKQELDSHRLFLEAKMKRRSESWKQLQDERRTISKLAASPEAQASPDPGPLRSEMYQALAEAKSRKEQAKLMSRLEDQKAAQEQLAFRRREVLLRGEQLRKNQEQQQTLEEAATRTAQFLITERSAKEKLVLAITMNRSSYNSLPIEDRVDHRFDQLRLDIKSTLKQQVEERRQKEISEALQDRARVAQWKKDTVFYKKLEQSRAEQERQMARENRKALEGQMQECRLKPRADLPSREELLLNKQLIEKAVATVRGHVSPASSPKYR